MIKYFCDICNNEVSHLEVIKDSIEITSGQAKHTHLYESIKIDYPIDHKVTKSLDLCPTCWDTRKAIEKSRAAIDKGIQGKMCDEPGCLEAAEVEWYADQLPPKQRGPLCSHYRNTCEEHLIPE